MGLAIPQKEALAQLESIVNDLGQIDAELRGAQAELEADVKKLTAQRAPKIDRLTSRRDELMDAAHDIVGEHWSFLMSDQPGKTLTLRGGTIALRQAPDALDITDEVAAIKSLRRLGMMRRFTRRGKISIDKPSLKKHPEVIAKMRGVLLRQTENMLVIPARTQLEIKKAFHPLRRRIGN